jgi:hypothetical protein
MTKHYLPLPQYFLTPGILSALDNEVFGVYIEHQNKYNLLIVSCSHPTTLPLEGASPKRTTAHETRTFQIFGTAKSSPYLFVLSKNRLIPGE